MLHEVVVASLDGADPSDYLPAGTELVIPEQLDLSTILGQPIKEIETLTLDGRTWISVRVVACFHAVGVGKTLRVEVPADQKRMTGTRAISVPVSRIFAVGRR